MTKRINHMTHYEGLRMNLRSAPCALIAAQRHSYCLNYFHRQEKGVILNIRTLMLAKCVCVCVWRLNVTIVNLFLLGEFTGKNDFVFTRFFRFI